MGIGKNRAMISRSQLNEKNLFDEFVDCQAIVPRNSLKKPSLLMNYDQSNGPVSKGRKNHANWIKINVEKILKKMDLKNIASWTKLRMTFAPIPFIPVSEYFILNFFVGFICILVATVVAMFVCKVCKLQNCQSIQKSKHFATFYSTWRTRTVSSPWNNSSGNEEDRKPGPKEGKKSNILPLWGNERTMNLNPLILTNIQSSHYFKVNLYDLKTYHEVIDEIYYKVAHLEPWEKGSRKTAGQTGMCGGVRGVGAGGIVSTAYCLLYKLFTLRLTRKQLNGLINHPDSPYIRALGFMYIRYTQPPADLFSWYDDYLEDEEELDVKAGGGQTMKMGEVLKQFLTKLEWFSTLFPRIPVPIQKELEQRLAEKFPYNSSSSRNSKPSITLNNQSKYGGYNRKEEPRHVPDDEVQWGEAGRASHWRARSDESRRDRSPRRKKEKSRESDRDRGKDRERDRDRDRHRGRSFSRERSRRSRDMRSRSRDKSYRDRSRERSKERHRDKDRHRIRRSSPVDYAADLAREKERQRRA
uniref:Pre-mRNA-splicing factor 38 n=1 Tax=Trichogramma kaykai TaxID=54128 RepID=A0ABD2XHD6_9HYME